MYLGAILRIAAGLPHAAGAAAGLSGGGFNAPCPSLIHLSPQLPKPVHPASSSGVSPGQACLSQVRVTNGAKFVVAEFFLLSVLKGHHNARLRQHIRFGDWHGTGGRSTLPTR